MENEFAGEMEDYDVDGDEEYVSWITWYCSLKGNEFFCMVDREFIADEFNLTGLSTMVTFYHYALDLILDMETLQSNNLSEEQKRLVESSAETLYGLIHARFITTSRGLKLMEEKYMQGEFGGCPRVFCAGQAVLPVGQSDIVRESSVKLFCPRCQDIYYPRSLRHKTLDGAFWGTTFPHLLLLQMRESGMTVERPTQQYVPRIYGFRIRQPNPNAPVGSSDGTTTTTATATAQADPSPAADSLNRGQGTVEEEADEEEDKQPQQPTPGTATGPPPPPPPQAY